MRLKVKRFPFKRGWASLEQTVGVWQEPRRSNAPRHALARGGQALAPAALAMAPPPPNNNEPDEAGAAKENGLRRSDGASQPILVFYVR
jgi:hypothetical protein